MSRDLLIALTGAWGVPGGIASANLNVLRAAVEIAEERGLALTVFSFLERASDRPPFLPRTTKFVAFDGRKTTFALRLADYAVRALGVRRVPLMCFDHVSLALPVLPLAASGLARTVIFAHGSEAWKRVRRTSRWSFRFAALCLTNSQYTLERMRRQLGQFRGESCPLGLSPLFRLNRQVPNGRPRDTWLEAADGERHVLGDRVFLLVSRLDPQEQEKGHRQLIRVMPELRTECPDVQLVFPGPGRDRDALAALARSLGVASSVFLPGFVSIEDLESLYRACRAFVMPSRQEGFGLVYLEAMNFAKPCVGCFDDGAEEVIVPGETGLLVRNPDDRRELIQTLRPLLRDPGYARVLGENGFRRLNCEFTARHHQERVKAKLSRLL